MTVVYIIFAIVILSVAGLYAVGEYFYHIAIRRSSEPPNEHVEFFKNSLRGTDREYLIAEVAEGKRFIRQAPHEKLTIMSRDSKRLYAKLFSVDGGAAFGGAVKSSATAILVHGYRSCGDVDFPLLCGKLLRRGYDVLIISHRASGESEGDAISFGVFERYDIEAWCRLIRERRGTGHKIVLFGSSMGAATVLMSSELPGVRETVSGIIADCGYTSPKEQFRHVIRRDYHLPPSLVLGAAEVICRRRAGWGFDDASAARAVANTTVPILFIHGVEDKYVPARFTLDNYEACASRRELLLVNGASHAFSIYKAPELYMAKVDEFLSSL